MLTDCGLTGYSGLDILEIGCATGGCLAAFRDLGARVLGIEPVQQAAEQVKGFA